MSARGIKTVLYRHPALARICVIAALFVFWEVAARSMGASDWQMFRYVLLPAALPVILTGLRIGFTVALLSILGSETIASLAGLGHRIVHLAEAMETARMFAYIAFAVAIAALLNTTVTALERRARRR